MVPFYGQGMNCGFEDCFQLDSILEKHKVTSTRTENLAAALAEYSETRHPDAHAMCDLAKYNYIEMRHSVVSTGYLIRRKVETILCRLFPSVVTPLYSMVSFSLTPYAQAKEKAVRQQWWMSFGICMVGTSMLTGLLLGTKLLLKGR
jgi:kynurenine 3-monooxygenase